MPRCCCRGERSWLHVVCRHVLGDAFVAGSKEAASKSDTHTVFSIRVVVAPDAMAFGYNVVMVLMTKMAVF